jgi:hypothetical protein
MLNNQIQFDFNQIQYHDTTHENEETVKAFGRLNHYANLSVLEVFEASPDRSFTPFEVYDVLLLKGSKMEFTSCRRAITDLETLGKVINTKEKVIERKGRPNYKWTLNTLNK